MTDKNTLVLQSCTDAPIVEHGLCSDTSVQSSGDGNDVISIKIEVDEIHIIEEDESMAISFSSINDESEVSQQTFHQYLELPSVIVVFRLSGFPHKSTPYGERKCSVYIYRV
jgi:hypothetical protein